MTPSGRGRVSRRGAAALGHCASRCESRRRSAPSPSTAGRAIGSTSATRSTPTVDGARGGSVRYRVPRAILRRFARAAAAGRRVEVGLFVSVTDREGNTNELQLDLRLKRP